MRYSILLLVFSSFFLACQSENPLVGKYQIQYDAMKQRMLANKEDMDRLLSQLPLGYQKAVEKGIAAIEKYDLTTFLQKERMDEKGLQLLFKSVNQFLENIDGTKNFKATEEQNEMYTLFKTRLLENRRFIDPFITLAKKSTDPNELSSGLFLEKVLKYDINEFVQNTFIAKDEFEKTFKDVNENWDGFLANMIMMDMEEQMSKE